MWFSELSPSANFWWQSCLALAHHSCVSGVSRSQVLTIFSDDTMSEYITIMLINNKSPGMLRSQILSW